MDALKNLFEDALLEDYDEAMETAEPVSAEAPLADPASTTTPAIVAASTMCVPPPEVAPEMDVTKQPTSISSGPSSSNVTPITAILENRSCKACNGKHPLRACKAFRKFKPEKKLRLVVLHRYCCRCLAFSHTAKDCPSKLKCRRCNGDHHILLHFDHPTTSVSNKRPTQPLAQSSLKKHCPKKVQSANSPSLSVSQVCPLPIRHIVNFSPTLIVKLQMPKNFIPVRAALDSCCSISYICESLVHQLRLPVSTMDGNKYCRLTVCSSYDATQKITVTAKVTKMKGVRTPSESVSDTIRDNFAGFQLADPRFNISGQVALVLGPEVTPQVLKGKIHSSPGLPLAQYTIFGWVITGQSPL